MSWTPYALSLGAGIFVGVIYGLIAVRSPAPPIIALLGLLGMLAGEAAVQWLRGHSDVIAKSLHMKSFEIVRDNQARPASSPSKPPRHEQET